MVNEKKPWYIWIKQIQVVSEQRVVYGLGINNVLYVWDYINHEWVVLHPVRQEQPVEE